MNNSKRNPMFESQPSHNEKVVILTITENDSKKEICAELGKEKIPIVNPYALMFATPDGKIAGVNADQFLPYADEIRQKVKELFEKHTDVTNMNIYLRDA